MNKILKRLGTLGKGFATIVGAILGVGGLSTSLATGSSDTLALCMTELAKQPANTITMLGIGLTIFGVARKAGAATAKP